MKNLFSINRYIFFYLPFLSAGAILFVSCSTKHASSLTNTDTHTSSTAHEKHIFANDVAPKVEKLTATGSEEASNTIFTNPAQDCSTCMDVSWITSPGKVCKIEVMNEANAQTYIYDLKEDEIDYSCDTFDGRPSRLANGANVVEQHHIDKHGYRLYNLKPDTDYSYRIITYDDKTGKKEYSETHHFHTAGAPHWKAAVLGDFHHYSPEPGRLKSAMRMLNVLDSVSGGIDWVLSTGDQCGWGGSLNFWTELSEQPGFINYMWASVEGNHDSMDRESHKTDLFFSDSHYFPRNGYAGQMGATYWFRYGDVLFIMLNNEGLLASGSQKQAVDWMERVIAANPSKYIVVVEHHQWLISTSGSDGQLKRWEDEFDRLGVDLAISGHNHAYLRTYPLYDGKPSKPQKGTYYVVNSSCDNERGRGLQSLRKNQDLVASRWSEGPHTVGGMVMDVDSHRIAMTLYDRDGHIEDTFAVPAKR